jgi:hypothetical protein
VINATTIIEQLNPQDIERRLLELEGEREALLVLRRAGLARERVQRYARQRGDEVPHGRGKGAR